MQLDTKKCQTRKSVKIQKMSKDPIRIVCSRRVPRPAARPSKQASRVAFARVCARSHPAEHPLLPSTRDLPTGSV